MKQTVIYFGSGEYTISVVEKLLTHNLALVVTTEKEGVFIRFLKKNNIPYIVSNLKKEEDRKKIFEIGAPIAILASYGAIIPQEILNHFKYGIWNIHPSLLPRYRGSSPIQATILNGDSKTGVTIIKLDKEVDHGPVLMQKNIQLNNNETMQQLKQLLFEIGSQMVEELLLKLENGEIPHEVQQNHENATFTKKITREDGFIEISNTPTPQVLERMTRAYHPWPGVWFEAKLYGKEKRVKLLPGGKIQVEGKKVMTYKEFINGYQKEGKKIVEKLEIA